MSCLNLIIHAGGFVDGKTYTNSLESLNLNIKKDSSHIQLCELDCVKLKDFYLIAHDGLEKHYGLNNNFIDNKKEDCLNLKIYNKFTPLFFSDLYNFIKKSKFVNFIIDSKHDLDDDFINHIKLYMKDYIDKIILQVYKKEDILIVEKYKIKCLYALWRYNDNAYNNEIKNNLIYINEKNIDCLGISLYNKFYENSSKEIIYNLLNHNMKVYIHGEEDKEICFKYINSGLGIFSHYPKSFSC